MEFKLVYIGGSQPWAIEMFEEGVSKGLNKYHTVNQAASSLFIYCSQHENYIITRQAEILESQKNQQNLLDTNPTSNIDLVAKLDALMKQSAQHLDQTENQVKND